MEQRFQLEDCLEFIGKQEFEQMFFSELELSCEIDVSDFCENGGWAKSDYLRFCSLQIINAGIDDIAGCFNISFTESTGDSCSHRAGEKRRTCRVEFNLDRKSGSIVIRPTEWEQRDYEPEEF